MKLFTSLCLPEFVVTLSSVILLLAQITLQERVCLTYRNETGCFEKADNATVFADPSITKMLNPLLADLDVYSEIADRTRAISPFYSSMMKYINRTLSLMDKDLNSRRGILLTDMDNAMRTMDGVTRGLNLPKAIASFDRMAKCISRGQNPYVFSWNVWLRGLLNYPNALVGRDVGVILSAAVVFVFVSAWRTGKEDKKKWPLLRIIPIVLLGANIGAVLGLGVGWLLDNFLSFLSWLGWLKWLTLGSLHLLELVVWLLHSWILGFVVGISIFVALAIMNSNEMLFSNILEIENTIPIIVITLVGVLSIRGFMILASFNIITSHRDIFDSVGGVMILIIGQTLLAGVSAFFLTDEAILRISVMLLSGLLGGIFSGFIPNISVCLSYVLGLFLDGEIGETMCSNDCLFGKSADAICQCPPKWSRNYPNPDSDPICRSCASLNREYSEIGGPTCHFCLRGYSEFVKGPKCYVCAGPNMILTNNICDCQHGYQLNVSDVLSEPCSQCTSTNRDLERNCTCKAHFDEHGDNCLCNTGKNREEIGGECVCKKNYFEYKDGYCKKCEEMNRKDGDGTTCLDCMNGFLEVDGDCFPSAEATAKCNGLFRKMENGRCSECQGANRTLDRNCDCFVDFETVNTSDWTSPCHPKDMNDKAPESLSKTIIEKPRTIAPTYTAKEYRNDANRFTGSTVALSSCLLVLWMTLLQFNGRF